VTGLNQNVTADDVCYHIQTEDVGVRAEVVSQVFVAGRVLHTYRTDYAPWKSEPGWETRVADQVRRQHALMTAAVTRGRLRVTP